jgi:hypothetical protein
MDQFHDLDDGETPDPEFVDQDTVVAPPGSIRVRFSYPLAQPVVFELNKSENPSVPWTAWDFALAICDQYVKIYEEEDATTPVPAGPSQGLAFNRNETTGKYGIWGHGIDDLVLDEFGLGIDGVWEINVGS